MILRRTFTYAEESAAAELIFLLLEKRGQFAVCPFPDDLRNATRTGWVVSWPEESTADAQPEEGSAA